MALIMPCLVGLDVPLWDELVVLNSYCGVETGLLLLFLGEYCKPGGSCPDPDGKNSFVEVN